MSSVKTLDKGVQRVKLRITGHSHRFRYFNAFGTLSVRADRHFVIRLPGVGHFSRLINTLDFY